jgi:hypothetical protein
MSEIRTADAYVAQLEPDRQEFVSAIRDAVNSNLDPGFEEMIDFGMIAWCIPLERNPDTYNGHPLMYAALASQKRYVSVYLMGIYADQDAATWFHEEYEKRNVRANMGKSCVRFRKLEDVPLDLIGQAIARYSAESYLDLVHKAQGR